MPKSRKLSGRDAIRILCNRFGFMIKSQKGSHILLIKKNDHRKVGCVVPLHRELKIGTLKGILEQACISQEEFFKYT